MASHNLNPVFKHVEYIQKFKFPGDTYDCLVDVFCLCYLSEKEIEAFLPKMEDSLTSLGYIVLMEPVLQVGEAMNERMFKEKGQHMMIRSAKYYLRLFKKNQVKVMWTRRDEKKGQLAEETMTFVLRDGTCYYQ